jgi:hypothetical protein
MSTYHSSRQPQTGDLPCLAFHRVKVHGPHIPPEKTVWIGKLPGNAADAGVAL